MNITLIKRNPRRDVELNGHIAANYVELGRKFAGTDSVNTFKGSSGMRYVSLASETSKIEVRVLLSEADIRKLCELLDSAPSAE